MDFPVVQNLGTNSDTLVTIEPQFSFPLTSALIKYGTVKLILT